MGLYNKGILGPFSGKVGTVVGSSWRGKNIMRSLPKVVSHTPSESQELQRKKFSFVSEFLTPIANVITLYFGSNSSEKTRMNQAMSYHLKNAVDYVAPNYEMLYNRVLISKGDLTGTENATAGAPAPNEIKFNWEDNSGQGEALATDVLVVVVYEPINQLYYTSLNAGVRSDANTTVTLPTYFAGFEVYSWITFASADGKRYATSSALPGVTITT